MFFSVQGGGRRKRKEEVFWDMMKTRRMQWLGSVNVLLVQDKSFILDYLDRLNQRFFTGTGGRSSFT